MGVGWGRKEKSVRFSTIQISLKKYCKKYKQNEECKGLCFYFSFTCRREAETKKAVSGGH